MKDFRTKDYSFLFQFTGTRHQTDPALADKFQIRRIRGYDQKARWIYLPITKGTNFIGAILIHCVERAGEIFLKPKCNLQRQT